MKTTRKMLFALVVLQIICVSCLACAETYSARNGVSFGMSMDEVKQIESKNLPSVTPMEVSKPDSGYPYMFYTAEDILGFEKCNIGYRFSPDNKLIRIMYRPSGCKQSDVDRIEKALSQKYGKPSNSAADGTINKFTAYEMESYQDLLKISDCLGTDYKQWLLPYDDCYVCLTFMYGKYENYGNKLYKEADMYLFYNYIGYDEIESEFDAQKQEEQEEQEKLDQLMNDL